MKTLFLKTLVAGLVCSPVAYSLSLYDTAPPIGLPDSHAVQFTASISAGYDDNLNSAKQNKKQGEYVSFGLGARYADYESVLKMSYHAHVGGQLYNKTANGTDQRLFSDISAGVNMSRSVSAGSTVSLSANVSYRPEPDYSNGISAARSQGDCFNWSLSGAYSQSIDSRWSWTFSASTSGNIYTRGEYKTDNRHYLSTSASLNYKYSTQTSYSLATSYRFDFREYGNNSNNIYLNASVNHAIDPVSSCSLRLGTQLKTVGGQSNIYPNIRAGYNRKLGEGFSMNSYLSLDNENVNTYGRYRGHSYNYLSDMTWRLGVDCSYALASRTTLTFGGSILSQSYSKGTGMADVDRFTWTLKAGLNYRWSSSTTFHFNYVYTHSTGSYQYGYDRNVVSVGASYTF